MTGILSSLHESKSLWTSEIRLHTSAMLKRTFSTELRNQLNSNPTIRRPRRQHPQVVIRSFLLPDGTPVGNQDPWDWVKLRTGRVRFTRTLKDKGARETQIFSHLAAINARIYLMFPHSMTVLFSD